jgi:predicted nucleotidyltransferase
MINLMTQTKNEFGLTEREMEVTIQILRARPEVKRGHIFGSRARGTFHAGSDIDLAIMNENVDNKLVLQLSSDFQESALPYSVDIANYHCLENTAFKDHIDRVGKLFYSR